MKLIFSGPEDVSDPVGQLRFGANCLQDLGAPAGLPELRTTCPVRQTDGSYLVYGIQSGHARENDHWRLLRFHTCDGLHYGKQELLYESGPGKWLGNSSIVHNTVDGSFLCLRWHQEEKGMGMYAFGSTNGVDWQPLSDKAVYYDHDAGKVMFDPRTGEYVAYQVTYQQHEKPYQDNCAEHVRRVLHIRTSKDGMHWQPSGDAAGKGPYFPESCLITPDDDDPPELEFYDFAAFPYEGRYVGMMQNYAASPAFAYPWGPHGPHLSTEWWISQDGRNWKRPFRDVFGAGPAGWAIGGAPITTGGRHVWIIQDHAYGLLEDRMFFAGALANAAFTTPEIVIRNPGLPLLLDASYGFHGADKYPGFRQQRYIKAELLDQSGKVIEGYEPQRFTIKNRDLDDGPTRIWWGNSSRMKRLDTPVRIRFYLRDARIFTLSVPGADEPD